MDESVFEMWEVYEKIQEGDLDEEDLEDVDFEQVFTFVQQAVDQVAAPHVEEIRQEAVRKKNNGESRFDARQRLENMDPEQQGDEFEKAAVELVQVAAEIHTDPKAAGQRLKHLVRNPWTMERLLLAFNNPNGDPGDEYAHEAKEDVTDFVRWFTMWLVPEVYTHQERVDFMQKLGHDVPNVDQQPGQGQGRWQGSDFDIQG